MEKSAIFSLVDIIRTESIIIINDLVLVEILVVDEYKDSIVLIG
jgi:hypothetical protein